jgi:16S rRNA (cytidine1402-2'-O)-methyltransferase
MARATRTRDGAAGRLVLVGTPIGNLGDLSPRAVEALRTATLICCEDTRRTGRLLQHAGVPAPRLAVCNEHTEPARIDEVLATLGEGGDVAVVTDAGTPGISDPGERLVRAVIDAGFEVTTAPGPTALVTALVTSGLPTGRFVFEGFPPDRDGRASNGSPIWPASGGRSSSTRPRTGSCARSPISPPRSAGTARSSWRGS